MKIYLLRKQKRSNELVSIIGIYDIVKYYGDESLSDKGIYEGLKMMFEQLLRAVEKVKKLSK